MTPSADLLRFIAVGALGFSADGGAMLALVHWAHWGPLSARGISFPVALSLTWYFNRVWTFSAGRTRKASEQYAAYALVQAGGFAINYAIFAAQVQIGGLQDWLILSLGIGAAFSMVFTFVLSQCLVFSSWT